MRVWAWLDSLGLVVGYSVILSYAIAFLRLRGMSWAFMRAWCGVLILALTILISRLAILLAPWCPLTALAAVFAHPLMGRVRAWVAMLAVLGLCVEFGRLLLQRDR